MKKREEQFHEFQIIFIQSLSILCLKSRMNSTDHFADKLCTNELATNCGQKSKTLTEIVVTQRLSS